MDHDDYSTAKVGSAAKNNQYGNHVKLFGTVKMLNNLAASHQKKVDGHDFTEMVIVARVLDVDVNSNRAKVLIGDSSGLT